MGVKSNLPEVRARRQAVFAGDEGRVKAQKDLGKLTARERLTALFDAASFVELNALNEDAGVVAGFGTIDGRGAYAFAQDFTVGLGAGGDAHAKKIAKVVDLARDSGSPVIGIYDTAGAKLEEGAMALDAYARIGAALASASGVVPSIALVMGHCGGIAAACAQMQDFVILSKAGELFVNGPQVAGAKALDDIAGGEAAMKGGACHIVAESDEAALGYARKLVSLLPDNNMEDALNETGDDVNRELPAYNEIETLEDARPLAVELLDAGSALELSEGFAPEVITMLGTIGGRSVGVIATQPGEAEGRLTKDGCRKAARFARFLDSFSMPLISLVDCAGMSLAEKNQGTLASAGAQLMFALAEAGNARVSVVCGQAVGMGYAALASRAAADVTYAWPGSVIAPLTAAATVQVLEPEKLDGAKDPIARRAELEAQVAAASALTGAELGLVDDVIEPALTRQMVAAALNMLESKRTIKPAKKQGNLPL